jgi:hypothetical protein
VDHKNQNPMRPLYVRRWTTLSCDGIGVAVGGDVVAVAVVAVRFRCHAACKPDRGSVQSKCQSHPDGGALGAPHGSFDGPGAGGELRFRRCSVSRNAIWFTSARRVSAGHENDEAQHT